MCYKQHLEICFAHSTWREITSDFVGLRMLPVRVPMMGLWGGGGQLSVTDHCYLGYLNIADKQNDVLLEVVAQQFIAAQNI